MPAKSSKSKIHGKPLTDRERHIASAYLKILKAKARAETQYELMDRLSLQLAKELGADGKVVRITTDGRGIQVVDTYKVAIKKAELGEMPKVWGHGAARQYEFKEVAIVLPAK